MGRPFLCSHPLPAECHRADLSLKFIRDPAPVDPARAQASEVISITTMPPPSQADRRDRLVRVGDGGYRIMQQLIGRRPMGADECRVPNRQPAAPPS